MADYIVNRLMGEIIEDLISINYMVDRLMGGEH